MSILRVQIGGRLIIGKTPTCVTNLRALKNPFDDDITELIEQFKCTSGLHETYSKSLRIRYARYFA